MGVSVPVIDCSPAGAKNFDPESEASKRLQDELHRAMKEVGCAYIINHGISEMDKVWKMADDFFNLPVEVKKKSKRRMRDLFGWNPYLGEKFEDIYDHDHKEIYDWSPGMDTLKGLESDEPCPVWPDDETLPGFQETHQSFFNQMSNLTINLMDLVGRAMNLKDPEYIRNMFSKVGQPGNMTGVRLLKYPPIADDVTGGQRLSEHKDYDAISLVAQNEVGGLEMKLNTGEWVNAEIQPGALLLITGELLEILSGGIYEGTVHRIGLPTNDDERRKQTRWSMVFYLNLNREHSVAPLDGSDKYPKQLQHEYFYKKIIRMYEK